MNVLRHIAMIPVMVFGICSIIATNGDGGGGDDGNGEVRHTVSGTVTLPDSVLDKQWFVGIDDDHDGSNGIITYSTGFVTGSTFNYSIDNVPAGDYFIYAEVDFTGNLGPWESGDYVGDACGTINSPCTVTIDSSKTVDFSLVVMPSTVSGNITLPESITDKQWIVSIDNDHDGSNGVINSVTGIVTGSTFNYSIDNVPAGDYFIYAEVDFSGNLGTWESGDYVGDACGTLNNPCTVCIDSSQTIDFNLGVMPPTQIIPGVHISYYDMTNENLKYATNSSGSWVSETVDSNGSVGEYTSIALDSLGYVHISYYDQTNGNLKHATNRGVAPGTGNCSNTIWDCETVDSIESLGKYTSLALDSSDNTHISYYDQTNGTLKHATNRGVAPGTGNCSNTNWDCRTRSGPMSADYSSIAIDSSDNIHISYYYDDDPNLGELKYVTNKSGFWISVTAAEAGLGKMYSSIALNSLDQIYISYFEALTLQYILSVANNTAGSWRSTIADASGGQYTSIAIDSTDKAHVGYGTLRLEYATNASGSWLKAEIDSEGAGHNSLALDSSDNAHISYYNATNSDLMYATNRGVAPGTDSCTDTNWDCEMVDSAGNVGKYTSLVVTY